MAGLPTQVDISFARAADVSLKGRIHVIAGVELLRRRGAVALRDQRLPEARRLLEKSVRLYRRLDSGTGLAEALLLCGNLGTPVIMVGLSEALAFAPPKGELKGRIHDAALALLMERLHEPSVTFEHYQAILGWIYFARRKWFRRRSKTPRKLSLIWAEGRTLFCLGLGRLAQRRLSVAWLGFSQLGLSEPMAVTALDLTYVLIGHDERSLALEVLRESRERVHRLSGDGELKVALDRAEGSSLIELSTLRDHIAGSRLPSAGSFYPLTHPVPSSIDSAGQDP